MKTQLAAILLTDVSGYTAFTAGNARADLAAAIQQLQRALPPVVERHGGRIVKWIGDAALVVFGSATEAVLCGHAIQRGAISDSERSTRATGHDVKAVVTLGDVCVGDDGDVFGEAVNLAARLEKVAQPGAVYFTDAVRTAFTRAEIPHEPVGAVELKGIPEPTRVYRTGFERSPVLAEAVALVATDFRGVTGLADRFGWDVVHPAIDHAIGLIVRATRERGGTVRSVAGDGTLLSFASAHTALELLDALSFADAPGLPPDALQLKAAVHVGTLHVMAHTLMGRDMHITERLADVAGAGEVLVTAATREAALASGFPAHRFVAASLADGPAAATLRARYPELEVMRVSRA